jgi:hypothetical protein
MDAAVALGDAGAPDAGTSSTSLVRHAAWKPCAAAADPFDDRPTTVECPHDAAYAQLLGSELAFDVDTGRCPYLSVYQPSLVDVRAGASIAVRLFHFALSAPEPAEAHAAVLFDGLHVLDARVPIPAEGGLITASVVAVRDIPAGTPIYFHLHNHGANSWALVEISVAP